MATKEDKRKCDSCWWYYISPAGCVEACFAPIDKAYKEERLSAMKQNCKDYRQIEGGENGF